MQLVRHRRYPPLPSATTSGSGFAQQVLLALLLVANSTFGAAQSTTLDAAVDGETLAAALEAGGRVELSAGTFTVPRYVFLANDLELTGAGPGSTIVHFPAVDVVGLGVGADRVVVRGLDLVLTGSLEGARNLVLLYLSGGELVLERVGLRDDNGGAGVAVHGGAAELRDLRLRGNAIGVFALDDAEVTLSGGTISASGSYGILGRGWGTLRAEDVTIEEAGVHGIVAEEGRRLELDGVTILDSGRYGLFLVAAARASVQRSVISGSGRHGIRAIESTSLTVHDSVVTANGGAGISIEDDADHEVSGVDFDGNATGTILLPDGSEAAPSNRP